MERGTESHREPFLSVKISSYLCSDFWGDSSAIHFLREQFWSAPMFWNAFFERAIILISWFMTAAYGWFMKDKLIDEKQFCALGLWILTEKKKIIN